MELVKFPGAAFLKTAKHHILFGTFSEIHQHLQEAGLPSPDTVVCGDVRLQAGIPQLVPEFLFFGHLFNHGHFDFATRKVTFPLTIIGTPDQCRDVRNIMQVSYLGASKEVLEQAELSPEIYNILLSEGDYYALKDTEQKILPIDAFIRFRFWEEGILQDDELTIEKIAPSRYRVREGTEVLEIDITLREEQTPVWALPEPTHLVNEPYSLTVLGAAGPFQTESPSSSYLLTLNGKHYLFDCAPYTHLILERLGIAPESIDGIFLSHIHDDHSGGLPAFLGHTPAIKLWTTKEIYQAARTKLASVLGIEESEIETCLDFHPVVVGEPLFLEDAKMSFHYASHSIPTIGVTIEVEGERLTLTGDTAGHRTLTEMLEAGIISQERFDRLMALSRENKVLVDCGEAIIHGYPQDYLHVPDTRNIVLVHRKDLPPEYEGIFTLARSLLVFPLKSAQPQTSDRLAINAMLDRWGISLPLSESLEIREYGRGQVIEGGLALMAYGVVELLLDGQPISRLVAGDLIGDALHFGVSGVRAIARGYVRLVMLPESLFENASFTEHLQAHWSRRNTLARLYQDPKSERLELPPYSSVFAPETQDGNAYLVCKGKLVVYNGSQKRFLRQHDLFGQSQGFLQFPEAKVLTTEACSLLKVAL